MNRQRLVLLVIATVATATAIIWRTTNRKSAAIPPATTSFSVATAVSIPPDATPSSVTTVKSPATRSKRDTVREVLSSLNHQPIEFYGKVMDQYKVPVAGAQVNAQVIYNSGISAGVSKPTTVTDTNGYFAFTGLMGRTLDFNITRAGYQFTPEGDAFDYTKLISEEKRHHPDPQNPVTLKMWKLQGAEPIIQSGRHIEISPDGTPIRVDLLTRNIVAEGGDVIITLKHERQPHGTIVGHYDWTAEINAVDGGIIESGRRTGNMFLAPESGYTSSLVINMSAIQADWSKTVTKNVYLKSRGNIYSRLIINIECSPTQPTSYVQLSWWANPSGSRNLEYDPAKRIEPK